MPPATATAHVRLLAVTALLALAWVLACRPAWSPDGKQVAYPAKVDDRIVLARHDRERSTSEVLFVPPGEKGQCVPGWLPDGRGLVALSSSKGNDKTILVTVLQLGGGVARTFEVTTAEDASNHTILPPVVVDNAVFFGGKNMQRLDLTAGAVTKGSAEPADQESWLARRGDGICYVKRLDAEDESKWELGTVDSNTLATRRLIVSPADQAYKVTPMPAFTKDLVRVAIPGERGEGETAETAILVFTGSELESVVAIGGVERARIGSLAFGPDDVTIIATVGRTTADGPHAYSLLEVSFSGSVRHETPLIEHVPDKLNNAPPALFLQAALSPDGKTAALTTAYLPHVKGSEHCLMLVDLSDEKRAITRVPFPKK